MDRERSPAEVLEIVRRRIGLVAACALVALAAASAVSLVLPKVYRVETKIQIEPVGLAGREAAEKINASKEQIRSHHAFEDVAKSLDLDAKFHGLPESERLEKTDAMLT